MLSSLLFHLSGNTARHFQFVTCNWDIFKKARTLDRDIWFYLQIFISIRFFLVIPVWFSLFDQDGDGKLSEDELRRVMVSIGEFAIPEPEFNQLLQVPRSRLLWKLASIFTTGSILKCSNALAFDLTSINNLHFFVT